MLRKLGSFSRNAGIAVAGTLASAAAMADGLDTAAVEASLKAAETSGLSVGTIVIGTVAALTVVGIVVAIIKKA